MTSIGIVGVGFMGMTHFEAIKNVKRAKVKAIATRSQAKLAGDWSSIQGNFGPRGSKTTNLKGIDCHENWADLIHNPQIDLVDICLPTDMHEEVATAAIKAGKHVMIEKPIACSVKSANKLLKLAEQNGVQLMVAHVLPFFPEFAFLKKLILSQKHGALQALHMRRVVAPPTWGNAIQEIEKQGGYGVDLHIHDNHFVASSLGMPEKLTCVGQHRENVVDHVQTLYHYQNGPAVTCFSGGLASQEMAFGHGYEAYFEKATVQFDAGTYGGEWQVNRPLSVMTNRSTKQPVLKIADRWCAAFENEIQAAILQLEGKQNSSNLSAQMATDALKLCEAERKSLQSGRTVKC